MPEDNHQDHFALFGNVRILRSWCPECQSWSLVVKGERQCCGQPYSADPTHYRRITAPPDYRSKLPIEEERRILRQQDNRCFYCDRRFGKEVYVGGKHRILKINWDHMVPFAYSQHNAPVNVVAACHVCNHWKGAIIFRDVEDAQIYLRNRWEQAEIEDGERVRVELYGIRTGKRRRKSSSAGA